jgi:hypothetical protein
MPERKPTHAQAQLQLQLYDLRREAKIRQAREWFMQNYFVKSIEDANRIAAPGSQEGTYMGMVMRVSAELAHNPRPSQPSV